MFKEYTKIRNSYYTRSIEKTLGANNIDYSLPVTIQEKLHGANFSVIGWVNDETFEIELDYYSRIQKVNGGNFHNVEKEVLDEEYIASLKKSIAIILKHIGEESMCEDVDLSVQLVGELYGAGILKGVDYGISKRIDFYDMLVTDSGGQQYHYPPQMFYFYAEISGLQIVPIIAECTTLKEALEYDVESLQTKRGKGGAEGIVIKPYENIYFKPQEPDEEPDEELFYIKKKSKAFEERKSVRKNQMPITEKDIFAKEFQKQFDAYITANRFDSVTSKHGMIADKKDIGKYCALLTEDAKEDFINDNPELIDKAREYFPSDREFSRLFKSKEAGKIIIQNSELGV